MSPNLKDQFFLDPNIIFLNHGSFGACARPVYENLLEWQKEYKVQLEQLIELFKENQKTIDLVKESISKVEESSNKIPENMSPPTNFCNMKYFLYVVFYGNPRRTGDMSLSAKTKRQGDRDPNGQNSGMQLRENIEVSNEFFRIQLGFGLR